MNPQSVHSRSLRLSALFTPLLLRDEGEGSTGALPLILFLLLCFMISASHLSAQNASPTASANDPVIEFVQNQVEVLRAGAKTWDAASTDKNHNMLHPGDQLRTGDNSRVGLRLPGHKATLILDGNSRFLVPAQREKSAFDLLRGRL